MVTLRPDVEDAFLEWGITSPSHRRYRVRLGRGSTNQISCWLLPFTSPAQTSTAVIAVVGRAKPVSIVRFQSDLAGFPAPARVPPQRILDQPYGDVQGSAETVLSSG